MKFSNKTKVLFQNRNPDQWIGGDMIQLEKTMSALQGKVDATFSGMPVFVPALLYTDFDIIHLWNFSMEWTKYQLWVAKKHGKKVVCSMIYHDTEAFISYELQQLMADNIDAFIFLTSGEVERARKHLVIPEEKIFIIPNGIDEYWLTTPKQKWHTTEYALTVGRIDGTKGQLETAIACQKLGIKYLCVGERMDDKYALECEKYGAILVPPMTHKELIKVYDNAKVFVLASSTEIFPLTVMEAGARGVNSVVTTACEWKDIPNVEWCNYQDTDSIQEAIAKSIAQKPNKKFINKLKKMTWENVGKQVLEVYKQIYGTESNKKKD